MRRRGVIHPFLLGSYLRIEPIFRRRGFALRPDMVLVLMPFSESWSDRIWEKLVEIVTGQGLQVERADTRYGPIITEDIWSAIVESRLIISDVTGWNPNVFYELGIAHTIGKDVILISQPTPRFPFDTQALRHLIYTDNPSGMRLLEKELPKFIQYYLQKKSKVRRTFTMPRKKELNDSWKIKTGNWNPSLPPVKYPTLRGQLGSLKKTMQLRIWPLSEEEAVQVLKEIREAWPKSWDDMDEEGVRGNCAKILEIAGKWGMGRL